MYELFDTADRAGQLFLVRITQNRITVDDKRILDEIRHKPRAGRVHVTIPRDSCRNVKEREAVLQVRYGQFQIRRPAILNTIKALKLSLALNGIYAAEETAGTDREPIVCFLMTNELVESFEAVNRCAGIPSGGR